MRNRIVLSAVIASLLIVAACFDTTPVDAGPGPDSAPTADAAPGPDAAGPSMDAAVTDDDGIGTSPSQPTTADDDPTS